MLDIIIHRSWRDFFLLLKRRVNDSPDDIPRKKYLICKNLPLFAPYLMV